MQLLFFFRHLMKFIQNKITFKRIISQGKFIPEIDGLRFIAVTSVVLYHLNGFIIEKYDSIKDDNGILRYILSNGDLGVPLFFVISGFVLGLPFANFYLNNVGSINLKNYFTRRITRLEPPYILVMSILLFGAVYVAKSLTLSEAIDSYLASIFYVHNIVYNALPKLNCVAWSLEIEIQFYFLAPFLAFIFFKKLKKFRKIYLSISCLLFLFINQLNLNPFQFVSIINFTQYFLLGLLLSDLYVTEQKIFKISKFDFLIGFVFFSVLWMFNVENFESVFAKIIWEIVLLSSIFIFYYYVLIHKIFKFLTYSNITNIGGMCYSIYLLHYPIISIIGNPLLKFTFTSYPIINVIVFSIFILTGILLISSIFYLMIERPCMKKDWYKKFF
jgi:peptidoglycan/LPS O-acetylase OafA/YrhL